MMPVVRPVAKIPLQRVQVMTRRPIVIRPAVTILVVITTPNC